MNPKQFEAVFEAALRRGKRLLVVGAPGVGKTQIKEQVARRCGFEYVGLCSPILGPQFVEGYPFRENGHASHAPFAQLARALDAKAPMFIDFDELGGASGEVIKACLRLFQFGEVAGRKLPDCVVLGASSNDIAHGAGVSGLFEPMKDRFHSIVNVEYDPESVVQHGLARGWDVSVVAWIRNKGLEAFDWRPSRDMQRGGATPRGYEYCSEWFAGGVEDAEVHAGCVGKAMATGLLAFRALMRQLPDIDAVLMDPEGSAVPEPIDAQYFVACALAQRISAGNFGRAAVYLRKLSQVLRVFAIKSAFQAENTRKRDGLLPANWSPLGASQDFLSWAWSPEGRAVEGLGRAS
jgi:hypothetical protein